MRNKVVNGRKSANVGVGLSCQFQKTDPALRRFEQVSTGWRPWAGLISRTSLQKWLVVEPLASPSSHLRLGRLLSNTSVFLLSCCYRLSADSILLKLRYCPLVTHAPAVRCLSIDRAETQPNASMQRGRGGAHGHGVSAASIELHSTYAGGGDHVTVENPMSKWPHSVCCS